MFARSLAILLYLSGLLSHASDALDLWSSRFSVSGELYNVTYTANRFIACGDQGTIVTSPDGLSWAKARTDTAAPLYATASDGTNRFLAVGGNYPGIVLSSEDANTWTRIDVNFSRAQGEPIPATSVRPQSLAFVQDPPGTFIMGAAAGRGTDLPTIYFSHDTRNWRAVSVEASLPSLDPSNFGPDCSVLVVGRPQSTSYIVGAGSIFSPIQFGTVGNDSSSFRDVSYPNEYVRAGVYGNGMFMLIGFEGPALVSTNGRDWQARVTPPPDGSTFSSPPPNDFYYLDYSVGNGLAFGNGTFVACITYPQHILTSTNGIWRRRPIQFPLLYSIAYGQGRFVAVGLRGAIVASEHVSLPGLSVTTRSPTHLEVEASGGIARDYILEGSSDLLSWTDLLSYALTAPTMGLQLELSAPWKFFRSRLLPRAEPPL